MLKKGVLSWKLCRQKWIFYGEVVVHRIISALAVYREERVRRNNINTWQQNTHIAKHGNTQCRGCPNAMLSATDEARIYRESFPGSGRQSVRRTGGDGYMFR
jgi:hypothetical protein